jgi:glucose-1-phosphate adenylyltransferase
MVLAGGEGKRLYPLTVERAKPAVPFGGRYRLIDFVLSNITNSGYLHIKVLTQYKSDSLIKHLSRAWNLSPMLGHYVDVVPAQMRTGRDWFRGSADAIYQNINLINTEKPDIVAIFNADHIYRMDVRQMVSQHEEKGADLTIAAIPVEASRCSEFGVIRADGDGRVTGYDEKPQAAVADANGRILASMGNYIFNASILKEEVIADAAAETNHDLAGNVVAGMFGRRSVYAYDFRENLVSGAAENERGYWKDVGTIDSYYGAHMDLVSVTPVFSLYNELWPIHSFSYQCPPAKFVFSKFDEGRVGFAIDSLVGEGTIVSGGTVMRSVIAPLVRINSYCTVEETVLMEHVVVGRRCKIRRAIVDKGVKIPPGTEIGLNPEEDQARFHVSPGGVVVIPKGYVFK